MNTPKYDREWYRGLLFAEAVCQAGQAESITVLVTACRTPFVDGARDYIRHRDSNPDVFENN